MGFLDFIGEKIDENIVQPVKNNVIKPAEAWIDTNIVQPVNENVIKPAEAFES